MRKFELFFFKLGGMLPKSGIKSGLSQKNSAKRILFVCLRIFHKLILQCCKIKFILVFFDLGQLLVDKIMFQLQKWNKGFLKNHICVYIYLCSLDDESNGPTSSLF